MLSGMFLRVWFDAGYSREAKWHWFRESMDEGSAPPLFMASGRSAASRAEKQDSGLRERESKEKVDLCHAAAPTAW